MFGWEISVPSIPLATAKTHQRQHYIGSFFPSCYSSHSDSKGRSVFPHRSASPLPSGGPRGAKWAGEPSTLADGTCLDTDIDVGLLSPFYR